MGRSELPMFIIFLHFSLHILQAISILTISGLQQGNGICPELSFAFHYSLPIFPLLSCRDKYWFQN